MGFTQFPDILKVMPFETSELVQLGRFKLTTATELIYIPLRIWKVGTPGGSETLTLKIYGSSDYAGTAYATSTAVTLSAISGITTNYIGDQRFTFNRENLSANVWYYLAMSTTNYTRNGNTYYLGAVLDWPHARNTRSGAGPAVDFQIVGYRE